MLEKCWEWILNFCTTQVWNTEVEGRERASSDLSYCFWVERGRKVDSANYLSKYLMSIVIPLEKDCDVPDEPPSNLPTHPQIHILWTKSSFAESLVISNKENTKCTIKENSGKGRYNYEIKKHYTKSWQSTCCIQDWNVIQLHRSRWNITFQLVSWRSYWDCKWKNDSVQITWNEEYILYI